MTAALEIRGVSKSFGALQVARDVHLALPPGARHALIGPNGAGKTTLVNLITGVLPADAGAVLLGGAEITRLSRAARVQRGLVRTFQITQLCRELSVLENVVLAVAQRTGVSRSFWRPAGVYPELLDEAGAQVQALGLAEDAGRPVRELPYGRQRLVEIAIALALAPKVLLLDEPAAGIPSSDLHLVTGALAALDRSIAVLMIEHDMDLVFRFAERITVLAQGAVLAEGAPAEIAAHPEVRAVYLGQGHGHG